MMKEKKKGKRKEERKERVPLCMEAVNKEEQPRLRVDKDNSGRSGRVNQCYICFPFTFSACVQVPERERECVCVLTVNSKGRGSECLPTFCVCI